MLWNSIGVNKKLLNLSGDSSDLGIVGRLLDDFRCHPEGSTNKSVPFYLGVCQLARHAEVCQLNVTLF